MQFQQAKHSFIRSPRHIFNEFCAGIQTFEIEYVRIQFQTYF